MAMKKKVAATTMKKKEGKSKYLFKASKTAGGKKKVSTTPAKKTKDAKSHPCKYFTKDGQKFYQDNWGVTHKLSNGRRNADVRGWRAKIAVVAPATNTIVQPDFEDFARAIKGGGVTNHFGRIRCDNASLATEKAFEAFQKVMRRETEDAAALCMTAGCDYVAMGCSAPTFYGGRKTCLKSMNDLAKRLGAKGISEGSFSCEAALKKFKAKKIAFISPYGHVGNVEVTNFFTECGFKVLRDKALFAPNPVAIAEINKEMIFKAFEEVDSAEVDALVQVGTNVSGSIFVEELEKKHKKPVIAINTATYWHSLRSLGIKDKLKGFGMLFEKH